jgi:hypothetical protein
MNYQKIYQQIVERAQTKCRSKSDQYYERHHILPRSLGGNNKKENLVFLTAREHFLCHVLLVKTHRGNRNNYKKMLHALMLMKGSNSQQRRYINSKLYESLKKEYSVLRSEACKGKQLSIEHKQKISASLRGHETSAETRQLISDKAKARKRKPFSEEYKTKMSAIMKERHRWRNKAE